MSDNPKPKKLELTQAEAYDYLLDLRDSGVTNMWGAAEYMEVDLDVSNEEATYWLIKWIKSFREE